MISFEKVWHLPLALASLFLVLGAPACMARVDSQAFVVKNRDIKLGNDKTARRLEEVDKDLLSHPHSIGLLEEHAEAAAKMERYSDAQKDYLAILHQEPKNYRAHIGLSRNFKSLGNVSASENELKVAASLASGTDKALITWELARLLRESRNNEAARAVYGPLMNLEFPSNAFKARAHMDRAVVRHKLKDDIGALADCRDALKLDPKINVYPVQGECESSLKLYKDAVKSFSLAVQRADDPDASYTNSNDKSKYLLLRAKTYKRLNNPVAAKKDEEENARLVKDLYDLSPFMMKK